MATIGVSEGEAIDQEIKQRQKFLDVVPEPVRTRFISLKAYPNKIVHSIQQVDGVSVEFKERM